MEMREIKDCIRKVQEELIQRVKDGKFKIFRINRLPGESGHHVLADIDGLIVGFQYYPDVEWGIAHNWSPISIEIEVGDILIAAANEFMKTKIAEAV